MIISGAVRALIGQPWCLISGAANARLSGSGGIELQASLSCPPNPSPQLQRVIVIFIPLLMHAARTRSLPLMLLPRSRDGLRDDSLVQKQQLMGIQISKQINRERGVGGGAGGPGRKECVGMLIISGICITVVE